MAQSKKKALGGVLKLPRGACAGGKVSKKVAVNVLVCEKGALNVQDKVSPAASTIV